MKPSRIRSLLLTAALLTVSVPAFSAPPSLRTIADVWGGTSNGNIAQGCTTFAPIADLSAFFNGGGFQALGGNAACGFVGATSDQSAASGSLLDHLGLPPVPLDASGSTYAGAADVRASFGSLGVGTQSTLVGSSGGTSATVSTAASFFHDTLSASSALVAPAAAGFVRYVFSLDGSLSSSAVQAGSAGVQLSIQQNGGQVQGLATVSAQGGDLGFFSAIDSDRSTWALGAGSVSGAGVFGSTLHVPFFGDVDMPMVWGTPWELTAGLMALTNRSADASFMASAKLVDIQLFDAAHQRITDFSLSAASGTDYLHAAAVPEVPAAPAVPEPATWALMLLGFAAVAAVRRRAMSR